MQILKLTPEEEAQLTALLNKASSGDSLEERKSSRDKAFEWLWPELEYLDQHLSKKMGTVAGSHASQPVTFARVDTTFDFTVGDGVKWKPTWQNPGHFLSVFYRNSKWRHIDALRSKANHRRRDREASFGQSQNSDCVDQLADLNPDPAAELANAEERCLDQAAQHAAWLMECQESLPDLDAFIYTAYYYVGCSIQDIQQLLQERGEYLTDPEISATLNRIATSLHDCLEKKRNSVVG